MQYIIGSFFNIWLGHCFVMSNEEFIVAIFITVGGEIM